MTNTPKFIRPHLSLPDAQIVADLLQHQLATHANWIESALIHGDTERATAMAKERENLRSIFGKFNGGIMDAKREEQD